MKTLREQPRAVKHVSFDKTGTQLAVSCTDGHLYMYKLDGDEPEMVNKVEGMIKSLEADAETSSKVLWHPDGRAFATPTAMRQIQVMSTADWERLGEKFYRKVQLYTEVFDQDLELENYIVTGCSYGGAIGTSSFFSVKSSGEHFTSWGEFSLHATDSFCVHISLSLSSRRA